MTREQLEAAIDAFGRPTTDYSGGLKSVLAASRLQSEWDAAHPHESAQRRALVASLDALVAAEEANRRQLERQVAIERAIVAGGFGERDIDAARTHGPLPQVRAWWEGRATWCAVLGSKGIGKTTSAAWCALRALDAGQSVRYRRMGEVARLSSFDEGRVELDSLKRVGLLVVDDVGTEKWNEYAMGLVFDLFDTRHANRRRTVIASNLELGTLAQRLGERLADRIQSDGVTVELRGASLRGVA
jgi:DNA replication protein DnaC